MAWVLFTHCYGGIQSLPALNSIEINTTVSFKEHYDLILSYVIKEFPIVVGGWLSI